METEPSVRSAADAARVLIVDHDGEARHAEAALHGAGFAIATVMDPQRMLRLIDRDVDLVLVADSPRVDAYGLCAAIRARSKLPIVMLGASPAEERVVRAYASGVDDYLPKPWSHRALVARIAAILRRSTARGTAVITAGSATLDVESRRLYDRAAELPLTKLETEVLRALLSRPGRTVSSGKLAAHAWNRAGERERHALKQSIYRLRRKLDREPAFAGRLESLRGAGYRWRTDDPKAR